MRDRGRERERGAAHDGGEGKEKRNSAEECVLKGGETVCGIKDEI